MSVSHKTSKSQTSHLVWYTEVWQQSSALNHSFYSKENRTRTCGWNVHEYFLPEHESAFDHVLVFQVLNPF